jgi:hypothetical protein
MRKLISTAGITPVVLYLSLVIFIHLDAQMCIESGAQFCGIEYGIAGFPWVWIFLSGGHMFLEGSELAVGEPLFWVICIISVAINCLIFYGIGMFVGNVIKRRRAKASSSNAH